MPPLIKEDHIILPNIKENEHIVISTKYSDLVFTLREFEDFFSNCTNIIQGGRNTVKQVDIGGIKTVIKSFKIPNKISAFIYRYFRKSKARRSYEHALHLLDNGIDTPEPIGYIEIYRGSQLHRSYYISKLLTYDFSIRDVMNNNIPSSLENKKDPTSDSLLNKNDILKAFVKFTYQLHSKNILHLDYSTGNILIKRTENTYNFSLVDINRMRLGKVTTSEGIGNFSRLSSTQENLTLFAKLYAKESGTSFDTCHKELSKSVTKEKNRRERKRRFKRLIKK